MAFSVKNCESSNTSCDVLPSGISLDEPTFFQSSFSGRKDDIDNIISAPDDVFHHPDAVKDDERHLRQTTSQMDIIGSTTQQGCNDADVSSALNGKCIGWTKSLKDFPPFTYEQLEHKLVKNSRTMPDNVAPKAYRNIIGSPGTRCFVFIDVTYA